MKPRRFELRAGRQFAAFSLVEIALSLGIIAFALVGLVGAIPMAANSAVQSIAQTRSASIANTLFAIFRAQPFSAVQYLDAQPNAAPVAADALNLNTKSTPDGTVVTSGSTRDTDPVLLYAAFDEVPSAAPIDDERRLHFSVNPPAGSNLYYKIVLRFNNNPAGTISPYAELLMGPIHAQANGIEVSISALDRPKDVYHFSSVIANRAE